MDHAPRASIPDPGSARGYDSAVLAQAGLPSTVNDANQTMTVHQSKCDARLIAVLAPAIGVSLYVAFSLLVGASAVVEVEFMDLKIP